MQFQLYLDRNRQYRWRLVASNGRIIADSGEAYVNRGDCERAVNMVMDTNRSTPFLDLTAAAA